MNLPRIFFFVLLFSFPFAGHAGVSADDFPNGTIWYLHTDLKLIRTKDSTRELQVWLEDEVYEEIYDESGIDLTEELDSVTAFSSHDDGTVIVFEGPISKESQDKLVALATLESRLDIRDYDGRTYYHAGDEEHVPQNGHEAFDDLEESAYFSFAVDNKAIVTSTEAQMKSLLENGGKIAGSASHDGALFVLTADQSLVQAGVDTEGLVDDDDDFQSNIIRNTEQAAILVAGRDDVIAVEAQLISSEPEMAQAIGGIINGLISLQAFNPDLDPEIVALIRNTKVEIDDNVLSINTVIDPGLVTTVLDD